MRSEQRVTSESLAEAANQGETLVLAISHPLLRHVNRSTVLRWLLVGKLPAVRLGKIQFTSDAAVRQMMADAAEVAPTQSVKDRNAKAIDSIARLGKKRGGK